MTPTSTMVPLEEYLHTSYEHDCEWVDGEVIERAMPDDDHSALQVFFVALFLALKDELQVRVRTELRLRVGERKYRIPDVLVMSSSVRPQPIPDTPPLICIEILSPDERRGELRRKLDDYVAMGVGAIWVVDPARRKLFTADADGMRPVDRFKVPGSQHVITPKQIFEELDSFQAIAHRS